MIFVSVYVFRLSQKDILYRKCRRTPFQPFDVIIGTGVPFLKYNRSFPTLPDPGLVFVTPALLVSAVCGDPSRYVSLLNSQTALMGECSQRVIYPLIDRYENTKVRLGGDVLYLLR